MKVSVALASVFLAAAATLLCWQAEAQLEGVNIPQSCCFSWSKKPIPLHLLSGYFVTSSKCSLESVIFRTVKGVEICTDPKEKWVQDRIKRLESRRKKP
ncbi:monocyte chemotactic protein 1B-like [Ornithorhynchus anatinus]|uniref:C-C motif chemokine n=1 Tax=Ornithorhynchus anatinus TaxID=9258 RepID=F7GC54_ORNAN|nr:monocyte chemotactic protein 1B-like [Ornithorhynchus anatinus]